MIRNFFGILFLVGSGFSISLVIFLGFTDPANPATGKASQLAAAAVPFLVQHLIGLILYRESHWSVATGVTFLAATLMSLMMVVNIILVQTSPEMAKVIDLDQLANFRDYVTGFGVMGFFGITGTLLFLTGRRIDSAKEREAASGAGGRSV